VYSLPPQLSNDLRVLLVSCYELGHEPLGVLTPAGVLDRAGVSASILDVAVDEFDAGQAASAHLVAISTPMHTALRLGARVAARVRELNPSAHICFYGLYAGLHARHLVPALADTCLDAEFEADLVDLVQALRARGGRSPREVVLTREPRLLTRPRERSMNLAPRRPDLPGSDRYVRLAVDGEHRAVGYVATTRGCKHLCRHCPLPATYDGAFYALPLDRVFADIDAVVARGALHVTFADADFLNGPTHALRVGRELHRRHPGVTFDYTAKIEHLLAHPGVVDELQAFGSLFVVSAVESFNDDVLARLDKGHSRRDSLDVIRRCRERGLTLRPSLVPFTPWETRESLAQLFDIVASEGLIDHIDPVQYSIRLLIPEGSLLLHDSSLAPMLGDFDPARFSYSWTHRDPAMDELQRVLSDDASRAAGAVEPVVATFARMVEAVSPGLHLECRPRPLGAPPRLTEDWFC